ncbi:MAG: restriction endonuclease, partial [Helicobacter sp.]|nr:restriction endonuclease [Helicobacter sp.]
MLKQEFIQKFRFFLNGLQNKICKDSQWKVKGFIDDEKNIFSLSNDTKIISKVLEIHIFPYVLEFAAANDLKVVLPNHQN